MSRPSTPGLSRFRRPRPARQTGVGVPSAQAAPGERCEMCAEPVGEQHRHVADLQARGVLCTCTGCYLLFTREGAGGGRFRAIPERYRLDPAFTLSPGQWDELQIPVRMAFLFFNSALDRWVGFYPSPAGATESLLPLDTWAAVMAANPEFADLAPDVEALLLREVATHIEAYQVPIDACYQLAGLVKLHWRGFDGGEEAWRHIDEFFAGLRSRAELVGNRGADRHG